MNAIMVCDYFGPLRVKAAKTFKTNSSSITFKVNLIKVLFFRTTPLLIVSDLNNILVLCITYLSI